MKDNYRPRNIGLGFGPLAGKVERKHPTAGRRFDLQALIRDNLDGKPLPSAFFRCLTYRREVYEQQVQNRRRYLPATHSQELWSSRNHSNFEGLAEALEDREFSLTLCRAQSQAP